MSEKEKAVQKIKQDLSLFSLKEQVEILANVLMFTGASRLGGASHIDKQNIADVIMKDRKSNGETIANALATQGLTMMLWLNNK